MKPLKKISLAAIAILSSLASQAEARWLENLHDFGAFDENDGRVTCSFRFVNDGTEPISITAARATCGCTIPSYSRSEILAGDTARIDVTYDPTGRPGRFDKKVYINLSDGSPRTTLRITGVVIGSSNTLRSRYPVDAGPIKMRSSVMAFGDVTKGQTKAIFFEVYNASTDTVTPQWENLPPYIHATTVMASIPPGEQTSYAMTFTADKTDLYGIVTDTIAIRPSPASEPSSIDCVANLNENFSRLTPGQRANAPVISTDTESVDFGTFDPTATASRKFTITNRGKDQLILRRVYTADPGVSVNTDRTVIKKGQKACVTVTVDPSAIHSELLNARIAIISNDPGNPTMTIRAVGIKQ